jgi:hypothetical protein
MAAPLLLAVAQTNERLIMIISCFKHGHGPSPNSSSTVIRFPGIGIRSEKKAPSGSAPALGGVDGPVGTAANPAGDHGLESPSLHFTAAHHYGLAGQ